MIESYDISLEEFDAINGSHVFSERYEKRKKALLKRYRSELTKQPGINLIKTGVAAILLLFATPVIVNAATGGSLFNRLWGNEGKTDVETHEGVVNDENGEKPVTVTYPKREYTSADSDKAEELIGKNISYEGVEATFYDNTKFQVLSAVSDGRSAVVEFTLERDGGVNCLAHSEYSNEGKGAHFKDDHMIAGFWGYSGKISVDMEKSTEDKSVCYAYMVKWNNTINNTLAFTYDTCDITKEEFDELTEKTTDTNEYNILSKEHWTKNRLEIPLKEDAENLSFQNEVGGQIAISPISMTVDLGKGLGLSESETHDPYYVYLIEITYKDGNRYLVMEKQMDGKHFCNVNVENIEYACGRGDEGTEYTILFNRLVNPEEIETIKVNETEYLLAE